MARRRHSPDQILAKLRDADVMIADGLPLAEVAKHLEVSDEWETGRIYLRIEPE